jgi:hypothetical protein
MQDDENKNSCQNQNESRSDVQDSVATRNVMEMVDKELQVYEQVQLYSQTHQESFLEGFLKRFPKHPIAQQATGAGEDYVAKWLKSRPEEEQKQVWQAMESDEHLLQTKIKKAIAQHHFFRWFQIYVETWNISQVKCKCRQCFHVNRGNVDNVDYEDCCTLYDAFVVLCRKYGLPEPDDEICRPYFTIKRVTAAPDENTAYYRFSYTVESWICTVENLSWHIQIKTLYPMMHYMSGSRGDFKTWFSYVNVSLLDLW